MGKKEYTSGGGLGIAGKELSKTSKTDTERQKPP